MVNAAVGGNNNDGNGREIVKKQILSLTHIELLEVISEMKQQLEEAKDAVDFYRQVTESEEWSEMSEVSKLLNMGMGRNKIFELLREKSILRYNNEPYQRFVDNGCFRLVEQKYNDSYGTTRISIKTVVSQKGLDFIRRVINEHRSN